MKIKVATHLGMCFGVRDAIKLAQHQAKKEPLTVLGDLVHNPGVLSKLEGQGIASAKQFTEATTQAVMITAHGTSNRMRNTLEAHRLTVHDATCPLVHHAHRELESLVKQGCYPIVIGVKGHTEVNGLVGDLEDYRIILSEEDIKSLSMQPHFGVVAQTTQPIRRVRHLVERLQQAFPESEVTFRDTVCQPTKNRQRAAIELSQQADVIVVIGGAHSNNTHELVKVCSKACPRVFHVQGPEDLSRDWFRPTDCIGITAGTSTPDDQIQAVILRCQEWANNKSEQLNILPSQDTVLDLAS